MDMNLPARAWVAYLVESSRLTLAALVCCLMLYWTIRLATRDERERRERLDMEREARKARAAESVEEAIPGFLAALRKAQANIEKGGDA